MIIIGVASAGGHFVQLERIFSTLFHDKVERKIIVKAGNEIELKNGADFYMSDFSRSNFSLAIKGLKQARAILRQTNAELVISTGALPGLVFILAARMKGIETIWIDSIANTKKISASGKLASFIAKRCYTQWPELADSKFKYMGSVI